MRVCVISDTHLGHSALDIPKCDLLIHCGDFSNSGTQRDISLFNHWIKTLKVGGQIKTAILIPGNHDLGFEKDFETSRKNLSEVDHVLTNHGIELNGLKIWGCSYVPQFFNWAFMEEEIFLKHTVYNKIQENLDILVCHGPPYGILDGNGCGQKCGSTAMVHHLKRIKPRYFFCGHIHEGRGIYKTPETTFINAAIMDKNYLNLSPIILDI
jgi:Icc-related predicted phosphoesterase